MYQIHELAAKAGITVRTLHHYDRIGLLHPSRHSPAGYRLYDDNAALRLQQILFYRELGLPLAEIGALLDAPDFDLIKTLGSHREELDKRIARLQKLRRTVDNTLAYVKGENSMEKAGIFEGFSTEEEEYYSKEAERLYDPETVQASNRRWKGYDAVERKRILAESKAVYLDMIAAMPKGAGSPEAQAIVGRWRANMSHFWTPSLEQLVPLAENYSADPRFKANFDTMSPGLAEFMGEAVRIYVERQKTGSAAG